MKSKNGNTKSKLPALAEIQEILESIIAPCITKRKTTAAAFIRGKNRYLNLPEGWSAAHTAVGGLEFLYRLKAAREAGDIDSAILHSYLLGRCLFEAVNEKTFGLTIEAALQKLARQKADNSKGGTNSSKWRKLGIESLAVPILADEQRSRVSSSEIYRRVSQRILKEHRISISADTIKRNLNK